MEAGGNHPGALLLSYPRSPASPGKELVHTSSALVFTAATQASGHPEHLTLIASGAYISPHIISPTGL